MASYNPKHALLSLSDTAFCVCFKLKSWKPQGSFNSTTLQATPLQPKILLFMLKAAKHIQPTCTVQAMVLYMQVHKQQNLGYLSYSVWQPTIPHTKWLQYYQWCSFTRQELLIYELLSDTSLWSTCHSVPENTIYSQAQGGREGEAQ